MSSAVEEQRKFDQAEELRKKLDSPEHLSMYGYTDNHCFTCGKTNSELDGKLLQCGMCKKAYYCSNSCHNADLDTHSKTCSKAREWKD